MQRDYKRIEPYIRQIDIRNVEGGDKNLLGVSVSKRFMPSIANTVGTDFTKYKVVKRNQFTYISDTSRRGDKIGIALLKNYEEALVSQAYTVFEITDKSKLDPEYLMMWFRRPEFDRYARYKSHGSVREIFDWNEMCNVSLPIPSIEKQHEIVAEYNTIKNRIALNNQLIQKLEETAQAIYKQWFVDFEFPVTAESHPELVSGSQILTYKSAGGKMVWNEEMDKEIPEGWRIGSLNEIVDVIDGDRGKNYPSIDEMSSNGFCLFLNAGNVTKIGFDFGDLKFISEEKDKVLRKGKLQRNDVVLTSRGTVGNVAFYSVAVPYNDIRINSGMVIMRAKKYLEATTFVYSLLRNSEMKLSIDNFLSGSAQPQLPIKDLIKIPITIPKKNNLLSFANHSLALQKHIDEIKIQNSKLKELGNLLLSKLATITNYINHE